MKPFNKERAIDGDPVITRSGKKVTELKFFNEADYDGISIVAKVKGLAGNCRICHFREDGTYLYNDKDIDLFMAPKKTRGWIGVYKEAIKTRSIFTTICFFNEQEARDKFNEEYWSIHEIEIEI